MTRIDPTARCPDAALANDVEVGAYSVIDSRVVLDRGVKVEAHVTIGRGVRVGEATRIETGARVGNDVLVGADVVIGANAVVDNGVEIGLRGVVRAGTHVTEKVPPKAIVQGSPARITGYVDSPAAPMSSVEERDDTRPLPVGAGCELWRLPRFADLRGSLIAVEYDRDLPFRPARSFFVFNVPSAEVRGEHAHRWCSQFLFAVHGALSIVVDDGQAAAEVRLDRPDEGLLIPPVVWGVQYRFTRDAVLGVFASHPYDADDYLRDYGEFMQFAKGFERSADMSLSPSDTASH